MSNQADKERKRIEDIQRKQIASRDPGPSKIRGYDWSKHTAKAQRIAKKKQDTPLLVELFDILPNRWRGMMMGLAFMGVVSAFLWFVVLNDDWKFLVLLPLMIGGIVGYILGKTTEWEE